MIEFAGRKVTANERAKLEILDRLMCLDIREAAEDYGTTMTEKELEAVEHAIRKRMQTIKSALGADKLLKKLDLWQ